MRLARRQVESANFGVDAAPLKLSVNVFWLRAQERDASLRIIGPIEYSRTKQRTAELIVLGERPPSREVELFPTHKCIITRIESAANLTAALSQPGCIIPDMGPEETQSFYMWLGLRPDARCAIFHVANVMPIPAGPTGSADANDAETPEDLLRSIESEMNKYDEKDFENGDIITRVEVRASPWDRYRTSLVVEQRKDMPSTAYIHALQEKIAMSLTRIDMVSIRKNEEGVEHVLSKRTLFQTTSAPAVAYVDPTLLTPETVNIQSINGLAYPWQGASVLMTYGTEALRVWLTLCNGYYIAMYERQMVVLDVRRAGDMPGIQAGGVRLIARTIIGDARVTAKVVEAAGTLLRNDGDCAIVAIYSPETASITPNNRVGWFVVDGNVPEERVLEAYTQCKQVDKRIPGCQQAIRHLRESWRNFIHLQYEDGSQLVIRDVRASYGSRVHMNVFGNLRIINCGVTGLHYFRQKMEEIARNVVNECTRHAALTDHSSKKANPGMQDTFPYWFDQKGEMSREALEHAMHTNFTYDENTKSISITPAFDMQLSAGSPVNAYCKNQRSATEIVVGGVTAHAMFDGFQARFLRALISSIYMYGPYPPPPGHSQLSHLIWRYGMEHYNERNSFFDFMTNKWEWLGPQLAMQKSQRQNALLGAYAAAENAAANQSVPSSARSHRTTHSSTHGDLVQMLFIVYVLNRPSQHFAELIMPLNQLYQAWATENTTTVRPKSERRR